MHYRFVIIAGPSYSCTVIRVDIYNAKYLILAVYRTVMGLQNIKILMLTIGNLGRASLI